MIKVNGKPIELMQFPNGETRIKLPEIGESSKDITINWKFESDSELFYLMCVSEKLKQKLRLVVNFNLVMSYVPYSRMDRVEDEVTIFTLKTFCKVINDMTFDNVLIVEPHSDVCVALLNNIKVISVTNELANWASVDIKFDENKDYIYYPDLTAYRRYSKLFPKIKYLIGLKKRNFESGEITGLQIVGDFPTEKFNVIMIDDLCSKGGSFVYGAIELEKLGMQEFSLVVTHCENSVFDGSLLERENFKMLYTTDSILSKKHNKIFLL